MDFIKCACRFTENSVKNEDESKRMVVKKLIEKLHQEDGSIDINIFKSSENVNIDTVLGYKKDGIKHNFLDEY